MEVVTHQLDSQISACSWSWISVDLDHAQWADWLNPTNDMAPLFKGSPAGTVAVERFVESPPAHRADFFQ